MWIANLLAGIIILFFGLIVRIFKASGLIAGYNTASKEEKSKYVEEELTRFIGNMLIISSVILLTGGLMDLFANIPSYFVMISWVLFLLIIVYMAIYANTGNHFKK